MEGSICWNRLELAQWECNLLRNKSNQTNTFCTSIECGFVCLKGFNTMNRKKYKHSCEIFQERQTKVGVKECDWSGMKGVSIIILNVPELWYKGINFNRRIEHETIAVLQDTRHHHLFIINTAVRNSEMNKTAQRFYASLSKRRYFHLKHIYCEFFYNLLGFSFWRSTFNIQRASIKSNSFEPIWKILLTLALQPMCCYFYCLFLKSVIWFPADRFLFGECHCECIWIQLWKSFLMYREQIYIDNSVFVFHFLVKSTALWQSSITATLLLWQQFQIFSIQKKRLSTFPMAVKA